MKEMEEIKRKLHIELCESFREQKKATQELLNNTIGLIQLITESFWHLFDPSGCIETNISASFDDDGEGLVCLVLTPDDHSGDQELNIRVTILTILVGESKYAISWLNGESSGISIVPFHEAEKHLGFVLPMNRF